MNTAVLSTADVAAMLGKSKSFVRRLIKTGRLRAGRIEQGNWCIGQDEADRLVQRLTGKPAERKQSSEAVAAEGLRIHKQMYGGRKFLGGRKS